MKKIVSLVMMLFIVFGYFGCSPAENSESKSSTSVDGISLENTAFQINFPFPADGTENVEGGHITHLRWSTVRSEAVHSLLETLQKYNITFNEFATIASTVYSDIVDPTDVKQVGSTMFVGLTQGQNIETVVQQYEALIDYYKSLNEAEFSPGKYNADICFGTSTPPPKVYSTSFEDDAINEISVENILKAMYATNANEDSRILKPGTNYYWKVIITTESGLRSESSIMNFKTASNYGPYFDQSVVSIAGVEPKNGSLHWDKNRVLLKFPNNIVVDPQNTDLKAEFFIQTGSLEDFNFETMSSLGYGVVNGSSWEIDANVEKNTDYFWYVKISNSSKFVTSPLYNFSTSEEKKALPSIGLLGPADGNSNLVTTKQILSWNGTTSNLGDLLKYDVYLGTSYNLTAANVVATDITSNFYQPTLAVNTTYYWKVIVKDTFGSMVESSVRSFTTDKSYTQFFTDFNNLSDNSMLEVLGFSASGVWSIDTTKGSSWPAYKLPNASVLSRSLPFVGNLYSQAVIEADVNILSTRDYNYLAHNTSLGANALPSIYPNFAAWNNSFRIANMLTDLEITDTQRNILYASTDRTSVDVTIPSYFVYNLDALPTNGSNRVDFDRVSHTNPTLESDWDFLRGQYTYVADLQVIDPLLPAQEGFIIQSSITQADLMRMYEVLRNMINSDPTTSSIYTRDSGLAGTAAQSTGNRIQQINYVVYNLTDYSSVNSSVTPANRVAARSILDSKGIRYMDDASLVIFPKLNIGAGGRLDFDFPFKVYLSAIDDGAKSDIVLWVSYVDNEYTTGSNIEYSNMKYTKHSTGNKIGDWIKIRVDFDLSTYRLNLFVNNTQVTGITTYDISTNKVERVPQKVDNFEVKNISGGNNIWIDNLRFNITETSYTRKSN